MKLLSFVAIIFTLGVALPLHAQTTTPTSSDVLVPGDPPLTRDMADNYTHFIQWALRTPLTIAQETRIKDYLVENWKAGNKFEIYRTLDILALRDRIDAMKLSDSA